MQQKEEFVLIVKTRTTGVDAAIERIRDNIVTNVLASCLGQLRKEIKTTSNGLGERQKEPK